MPDHPTIAIRIREETIIWDPIGQYMSMQPHSIGFIGTPEDFARVHSSVPHELVVRPGQHMTIWCHYVDLGNKRQTRDHLSNLIHSRKRFEACCLVFPPDKDFDFYRLKRDLILYTDA